MSRDRDETVLARLEKIERRLLAAGGNLDATGLPYTQVSRCPDCAGAGECERCGGRGVISVRHVPRTQ